MNQMKASKSSEVGKGQKARSLLHIASVNLPLFPKESGHGNSANPTRVVKQLRRRTEQIPCEGLNSSQTPTVGTKNAC